MTELDIRVGDVVRLKPMKVTRVVSNGTIDCELIDGTHIPGTTEGEVAQEYLWVQSVESIISHSETDAEKIARLEGELGQCKQDCADWEYQAKTKSPSKIEWLGGPRPISPNARAIVWSRNGETRLVWAMGCRWDHDQSVHDIIAYMVLPS